MIWTRIFVVLFLVMFVTLSSHSEEGKQANGNSFKTASNWDAYNAGAIDRMSTKGYFGATFDGRYIYFVPCREGMSFHGRVLRYDTKSDFKKASAWSAFDAGKTDGLKTIGYAGAVYDGRYVYFIPFVDGSSRHGRVLRYDTKGDFRKASGWNAYDAGKTDGLHTKGFVGAEFDGRYIYFVPFGYSPFGHGRVLRFDTKGDFKTASSWNAFDAGSTGGLNTKGFYGGAFDGRYVYFVPFHDGSSFHGRALRFDTKGDFKSASSWNAHDAGSTGGLSTKGYKWALFDGRYIYYIPFRDQFSRHCRVLRFDTKRDFGKASSWSVFDAGSADGLDTKGYVGAAFDKRYIYFIPYSGERNSPHAKALRFDTKGDFRKASAWSAYDAGSTDGLNTKGYKGAAFDGKYVYYVPYENSSSFSGIVLRYNTSGR